MGSVFEFRVCYIAGVSVKIPAKESPTELLSFISVTAPNAKVEFKSGNRTLRA